MALPSAGGITVQAKWVCPPLPMVKSHSLALWSHPLGHALNRLLVVPTIQPLLPVSKGSLHFSHPKKIILDMIVSDGGQMFTWGCGTAGQLGHGNVHKSV